MPAPLTPVLDAPGDASVGVAMATFDSDLVCTYATPAFAQVAGGAGVHGSAWEDLFPGLSPSQQAVVAAVATDGPPVGEVDVTPGVTRSPLRAGREARRRWRFTLHRVEGVAGVRGGRVVSVVGTLALGPAVLDPSTFRHRVADTLRSDDGTPGVLLVDLGPHDPHGLTGRAGALHGVIRTTDIISVDVDDATGRSYLALLCPSLPAPWTAAVIGDRLRRAAQLVTGLDERDLPQVSVTVARPDDSADSLLRRASSTLHTDLRVPVDASPLRTTVREHLVGAGRAVVVRLTGEADLSTLRGLVTLLEAIVEDEPVGLVIDASQLGFCDVATVRALVGAAERAARSGAAVGVAGMPPTMERVVLLGWAGSALRRWRTVEEALAAL